MKSSSIEKVGQTSLGLSMTPSNPSEFPMAYADDVWDIAAEDTSLSNELGGEGQFSQHELNERFAQGIKHSTGKIGYTHYVQDASALLGFADLESYENWVEHGSDLDSALILTKSVISTAFDYQILLTRVGAQTMVVTKSDANAVVKATFVSQRKRQTETEWTNVAEGAYFSVYSELEDGRRQLKSSGNYVESGGTFEIDIKPFLASGENKIVVTCSGARTSAQPIEELHYDVTFSSLGLYDNGFQWYLPKSNSVSKISVPLSVEGNIRKTIEFRVYSPSNVLVESKSIAVGTTTGTRIVEVTHPNADGVYRFEAWAHNEDSTITTEDNKVVYNFICYVDGSNKVMVAVNNVAEKVYNYSDATLFDYAVYANGGSAAITFTVTPDNGLDAIDTELVVDVGVKRTLTTSIAYDQDNGTNFGIEVTCKSGGVSAMNAIEIPVDNSVVYVPVQGATYVIDPARHNNSAADYLTLKNDVDGTAIAGASFSNTNGNNDVWTKDDNGKSVLRLLAGSSLNTGIKMLEPDTVTRGMTLDLDVKLSNSFSESNPFIEIAKDLDSGLGWQGIKIAAEEAVWHTRQQYMDSDSQNIQYRQGVRLRLSFVVYPNYGNLSANNEFCVIQMYVNGRKNRAFEYDASVDGMYVNSPLVIGSDAGDVDIYNIRVYNRALTENEVWQNFVSYQDDNITKSRVNSENNVLDVDKVNIDYNTCRSRYNTFVISNTADNGNTAIPHYGEPSTFVSDWRFEFADNEDWNVTIKNVPIDGQGTSSKQDYYRWNLRGKCGDNTIWEYGNGTQTSKSGYFGDRDKYNWKISKITAKKNVASSSQSHKMGSVNSIDDLANQMEIYSHANRISVYQYPFVGFAENTDDNGNKYYTFIGLYTVGPDKGDSKTFGYDTSAYPNLLMVEGSDNGPLPTLFRVPWNSAKGYFSFSSSEEALFYNRKKSWDYDQGAPKAEKTAEVMQLMLSQFRPTYNWVHSTNRMIRPWSGTISSLNASLGSVNKEYEYWTKDGKLYYYEDSESKYILDDDGEYFRGDLVAQLGITVSEDMDMDEMTETIRELRLQKFVNELESVGKISKSSTLFKANWDEVMASTDTNAKNTYFYRRDIGGMAMWLFDDTDTIILSNNQGLNTKSESVEMYDDYKHGWDGFDVDNADASPVYNGATSVMWSNVRDGFYDSEDVDCDGYSAMRNMLNAMAALAGHEVSGFASIDQIMDYFEKYYFDAAQDYFPAALYNADAYYTYELVQYLKNTGGIYLGASLDPIRQGLGDNQEPERNWIRKRIVYLMSKYKYGIFSPNSTDNMTFRASTGEFKVSLKYVYDMYHAISNGTTIVAGERTKARRASTISTQSQSDQNIGLLGSSYITDVGDWHKLNITEDLDFNMPRLEKLVLGNSNAQSVVISCKSIRLNRCVNLKSLDVRNVSSLNSQLNLSNCVHIREVKAGGSNVPSITLPSGGMLSKIEYPASNQIIRLRNFPMLNTSGIDISRCMTNTSQLLIDKCGQIAGYKMLSDILDAQRAANSVVLEHVRLTGVSDTISSSSSLVALADMLEEGTIHGITVDGNIDSTIPPVIEGTVTVTSPYYQSDVDTIRGYLPRLTLVLGSEKYVEFEDALVQELLVSNGFGDGVGVTENYLSSHSFIQNDPNLFKGTDIEYFDEFGMMSVGYMIGYNLFSGCSKLESVIVPSTVSTITSALFSGCSSLKNVTLPTGLINMSGASMFSNCSSLESIEIPQTVNSIGYGCFANCTSLTTFVGGLPSALVSIGDNAFSGCKSIQSIAIPNRARSIGTRTFQQCTSLQSITFCATTMDAFGEYMCYNCTSLTSINVPSGIQEIPLSAFYGCSSLQSISLPSTVKKIGRNAFRDCGFISINIPSSVEEIEYSAFAGCQSATSIVAEEGLKTIGQSAFGANRLVDYVLLPSTIEYIGSSAFIDLDSCRYVKLLATTPPTLESVIAFARCGIGGNCPIFVPDDSYDDYVNAQRWNGYSEDGNSWGLPGKIHKISEMAGMGFE